MIWKVEKSVKANQSYSQKCHVFYGSQCINVVQYIVARIYLQRARYTCSIEKKFLTDMYPIEYWILNIVRIEYC